MKSAFKIFQLFTICHLIQAKMLKFLECGIYDAEFTFSKSDHRFDDSITKTTANKELQECLMGCTVYPNCFSVNYKRDGRVCEFVGTSTAAFKRRNIDNLVRADGWTYFDTKEKDSYGPLCAAANPCAMNQTCEDRCGGQTVCKDKIYNLRSFMGATSASSLFGNTNHGNVIDGFLTGSGIWQTFTENCFHSAVRPGGWWKVAFLQRVAITKFHFYNRHSTRYSSNLLVQTLVTNREVTTKSFCANTGDMDNVIDRLFYCQIPGTLADEFEVVELNGKHMNFCEIIVYGWTF